MTTLDITHTPLYALSAKTGKSSRLCKREPAKRVDLVTLKLVREGSVLYANRRIQCADDAYKLLRPFVEDSDREQFLCLCLSTKHEPLNVTFASTGSLDATIVHPREIFKTAVLCGASAILVCHNHPSGDPTPSQEDVQVTSRLVEAGKILGIDVLALETPGSCRFERRARCERYIR